MPAAVNADCRKHFLNLSPGKLAGLNMVTDANARFKVLAIDQSGSFKKAIKEILKRDATDAEIRDAKLEMTKYLAVEASSVLLDITFAARQVVATRSLPRNAGLIVRLEKGCSAGDFGYEEVGWNVSKIKKMGGSAVKLLVYMDTSNKVYTEAQLDFVKRTYDNCKENDILLMTEELSFPHAGEDKDGPEYKKRKVENILKSTELLGPWTDILKLEYPGDENVAEMNRLAIRPWVLLSAGVDFEIFEKQVEAAMKAGASGIMAGRAIFKDWFKFADAKDRLNFLQTKGLERMRKLNALVDKYATPWLDRAGVTAAEMGAAVKFDWYSPLATGGSSSGGVY